MQVSSTHIDATSAAHFKSVPRLWQLLIAVVPLLAWCFCIDACSSTGARPRLVTRTLLLFSLLLINKMSNKIDRIEGLLLIILIHLESLFQVL